MEKLKITKIANYNGINYFQVEKRPNMNRAVVELAYNMGFSSDEITDVDLMYEEFSDGYAFLGNKETKLHIFTSDNYVHIVIDSHKKREDINILMKKYCEFPKQ